MRIVWRLGPSRCASPLRASRATLILKSFCPISRMLVSPHQNDRPRPADVSLDSARAVALGFEPGPLRKEPERLACVQELRDFAT